MKSKKVSVIIPAYNESDYIEKTIEKYKEQDYDNFEIIVVDNSDDDGKTYQIAKPLADKIIQMPGPAGPSAARNEGTKLADGEIFIFSDADSWLEREGIKKIVAEASQKNIIGSVLGKDEKDTLTGRTFFFFKNWIHRLKIYEGVIDGIIFCSRDVFFNIKGFNKEREPGEFQNFITKAKKNGARYKLITNSCALTSMRRYEKKGYLKTILFWFILKILNIFKKEKKIRENYYKKIK